MGTPAAHPQGTERPQGRCQTPRGGHYSQLATTIPVSVHRHREPEYPHGALDFKRYLCEEHPKLRRSAPTKRSSTSEGVQEQVRSKWRHKKLQSRVLLQPRALVPGPQGEQVYGRTLSVQFGDHRGCSMAAPAIPGGRSPSALCSEMRRWSGVILWEKSVGRQTQA